ncbi:MAG TPA: phage tail sheath C-terminal domain-containing protein [Rhizomicrobium sp.]|nr:phage tail sheath C-terminal domain-containing protein [Rhizomicrobium sp.]
MPVAVSYPGVYLEEVPSGVRTITGVATSIAAFVDYFPQGPIGSSNAVEISSFADFERGFGGLNTQSEASYAIHQFFLNGGAMAYVIRVTPASDAAKAATATLDKAGGGAVLTATAQSEGAWGNSVRLDVDYDLHVTSDPANSFNLTVTRFAGPTSTQVLAAEKYVNLVIDNTKPNDVRTVVNNASQLVTLSAAASDARPAASGTISASLAAAYPGAAITNGDSLKVTLTNASGSASGTITFATAPTSYGALASAIQSQLRGIMNGASAAMPAATATLEGSETTAQYIVISANLGDPTSKVTFADGTGTVQSNFLKFADAAQDSALAGGDDGGDASASDFPNALIGDPNLKTGIYALEDVDIFNILCIPVTMKLDNNGAKAVATEATALCQARRAMYILDPPGSDAPDTVTGVQKWLDAAASLRSRNAALYFPRVKIPDPLNNFNDRTVAPSGTMAGLYARTDTARGVWKAPAGTDATLSGVDSLAYRLNDAENGILNPLAINCLRTFPIYGNVCWGARTLYGADQMSDDYKYIPIRRLALYIEESLYRGTQWVVFEPNAAPLWAQIRLNVGAFMQNLFRQGAFFGTTPTDAYFVACDSSNNPQNTIDLGIVNITVGFAPLKPAEFVIIQIQQMAGQIAS